MTHQKQDVRWCFNSFRVGNTCPQSRTPWFCQRDRFVPVFHRCFGGLEGETFKARTGGERKARTWCQGGHCQHPETPQVSLALLGVAEVPGLHA